MLKLTPCSWIHTLAKRTPVFGANLREFHACGAALVRQKHLKRLNRLHKHWAKQMFKTEEDWIDPVLGKPKSPFILRIQALISQSENQIDLLEPEQTSKLVYAASITSPPPAVHGASSEKNSQIFSKLNDDAKFGEDAEILARRTGEFRQELDTHKREALRRILSLHNSNRQQSQKQAVQLATSEFARFEGDTGSPEVQAAVATIRIHFVAAHAKETKKDLQTKRRLEHMVQMRRNILLYLKRKDPRRYIWTIEKLGLSDQAVQSEFHMSRKYLWKTQFYGDQTLAMKKTVKDTKEARDLAVKRGKAERYLAQHDPDALIRTSRTS